MTRSTPHTAMALMALIALLAACGGGRESSPDALELCEQGNVEEGFRLLETEAADPQIGITDATLGRCLAAAVVAADERGEWKQLPERLDKIQTLASAEPGPELVAAEIEARAALAHARCTDRLCCLHDGLAQYQALHDAVAGDSPERVDIVERWYTTTRDEMFREGQWVVEIDGRMSYAPTVGAVIPARPEEAYRELLGKEIVLNNVLMMAETKGSAPQRSGDRFGREIDAGLDAARHRKMIVRRPGAADGTVVAGVWSEAWDSLLADLHPGVLNTCRGTVIEVKRQGIAGGLLEIEECTVEQKRTDALFRQRKCTVCGVRDDQEVCHDGYGRNDGQAFHSASELICAELLLFDETPADCISKVQMSRWCGPNDDPATPPAPDGEQTPPGTTVDPS